MKSGIMRGLIAAVAAAGMAMSAPAHAETSDTNLVGSGASNTTFRTTCRPGGVLVGVNGKAFGIGIIYAVQPVCVNTSGRTWSSPTYTGNLSGTAMGTDFSRVCPTNTVVKSISGGSMGWLGSIRVSCQALNEAGNYEGPVTDLPLAGFAGASPAGSAACPTEQPARGLFGGLAGAVSRVGLTCGTRMEGLKRVARPQPSNLGEFVADRNAAIVLGKALFWDMQLGSDAVQACASCHFHAGVDNRGKNQVNPGLARASSPTVGNPDTTFQVGGPNHQFVASNFPFFQRANPDDPNSPIVRDINDIASSQGVFNSRFLSGPPGQSWDNFNIAPDPVFKVGSTVTRRVAPRNTPTTINAVFNFRNFWDGRAQWLFNGVNPFGARDPNARVFRNVAGMVTPVQVRIDNASLASQAVGPPSSNFEMSADGRTLMDIGKRLLTTQPLRVQNVAADDSVLGPFANTAGRGLTISTYEHLVRAAFRSEWWSGTQAIQIDSAGNRTIIPMPASLASHQYSQMQANFSLFFGLAIQLYESTLVSDDSPFDRYMEGNATALNADQLAGMELFNGKGKCANCHKGAEFTGASVRRTLNQPLERMVMGNGGVAVYDQGFYNIGVRPTLEDILNGGRDALGKPLSFSAFAQQFGSSAFQQQIGISPNLTVAPGERIAVLGAAKTPSVRNVELMNPHMHNGGLLNLQHVLEFYNRGGNFRQANINDLDADITTLGLSATEKNQIIAFMKSLTDERVRRDAAPFDHPSLGIPNGHRGDTNSVQISSSGWRASDDFLTLPAVGRNGTAGPARPNFLNVIE